MKDYELYILPSDDTPWLTLPETSVNLGHQPETIDVSWPAVSGVVSDPRGEVVLRFRPVGPTSRRCYLVAMSADYTDGWLARHQRSL